MYNSCAHACCKVLNSSSQLKLDHESFGFKRSASPTEMQDEPVHKKKPGHMNEIRNPMDTSSKSATPPFHGKVLYTHVEGLI